MLGQWLSCRDHSVNVPCQWEKALHCNAISHWLGRMHRMILGVWNIDEQNHWAIVLLWVRQSGELCIIVSAEWSVTEATGGCKWLFYSSLTISIWIFCNICKHFLRFLDTKTPTCPLGGVGPLGWGYLYHTMAFLSWKGCQTRSINQSINLSIKTKIVEVVEILPNGRQNPSYPVWS